MPGRERWVCQNSESGSGAFPGLAKRPLHPNWDGENLPDGVYWRKLSGRAVVNGFAMKGPDGGVLLAGELTIRRK